MPNNSEYFRAHLESEARNREHAKHIDEFSIMCKMMIEEMVPILIEDYLSKHKLTASFDIRTYFNKRFVDSKDELTHICAKIWQKMLFWK